MANMHFGRTVPVNFRRFPSLVCRSLLGKTIKVPQDLEGQLNLLVVGFRTSHYKAMDSWTPFVQNLKKELLAKHNADVARVHAYRLVIRQRGEIFLRWWTDERLRLAVGTTHLEVDHAKSATTEANQERQHASGLAASCTVSTTEQRSCEGNAASTANSNLEDVRLSRLHTICSRTLTCFTDKRAFIDSLQLPDAQRVYIFLVDQEGGVEWCEHEGYSPAKEKAIRELLQLPVLNVPSPQLAINDVGFLPECSERQLKA
ncbi:hypothetical protein cyc_02585 [Cyclospora cayetanensis]|uniref:Uncharacterized protein n=1 Tax=Cyclospora cayetanensis TaxID=88456 RepID=A0A1D3CYV3_9EIME|nr:hypothetical protein cyc_02585 [Cyclospora cayetanensis]